MSAKKAAQKSAKSPTATKKKSKGTRLVSP
jgi:hypothetical protein